MDRTIPKTPLGKARTNKRILAENGDANAGQYMLQTAMSVLYQYLNGKELNEADRIALEHLHQGLRSHFVDGLSLNRALGIERAAGAPKKSKLEKALLIVLIDNELSIQTNNGEQRNIGAVHKKVARKEGVSVSTVKSAWQAYGSMDGYKHRQRTK